VVVAGTSPHSPGLALSAQVLVDPKAGLDNTVLRRGHRAIVPEGYEQGVHSEFGRQGRLAGQMVFAVDTPRRAWTGNFLLVGSV